MKFVESRCYVWKLGYAIMSLAEAFWKRSSLEIAHFAVHLLNYYKNRVDR